MSARTLWKLGLPWQIAAWHVPILVGTTLKAEAHAHTLDEALRIAQTICDAVNGVSVTDPDSVRDALLAACQEMLEVADYMVGWAEHTPYTGRRPAEDAIEKIRAAVAAAGGQS